MTPKTLGGIVLAMLVALGAGWVWGASGKSTVDQERRRLEQRADYEAARAALSQCQFKPGTVDGTPEKAWANLSYVWRME